MIAITIAAVLITGSVNAGYIYPRPNIAFELPKNRAGFNERFIQKTKQGNSEHRLYEGVSYSVLNQDHYVDNRNNVPVEVPAPSVSIASVNALPVSKYISSSHADNLPIETVAPVTPINYEQNLAVNSLSQDNFYPVIRQSLELPVPKIQESNSAPHINVPTANVQNDVNLNGNLLNDDISTDNALHIGIPTASFVSTNQQQFSDINRNNVPTHNLPAILNQQNNFPDNIVQYEIPPVNNVLSVNSLTPVNQQSSLQLSTEQQLISQDISSNLNSQTNIQQSVISPIITKDIYFHVPPAEIEEPSLSFVSPKKKIYKIIFIKVPSLERNNIYLHGNAVSQGAPIEEKTIIYVLSKKAETPEQVFLPKPTSSEHEVLFVKYSGNAQDTVAQISEGLDHSEQPDSQLESTQTLQPGLINGKR